MNESLLDFARIVRHLREQGVEVVVIGGFAAVIHGVPHVTTLVPHIETTLRLRILHKKSIHAEDQPLSGEGRDTTEETDQ